MLVPRLRTLVSSSELNGRHGFELVVHDVQRGADGNRRFARRRRKSGLADWQCGGRGWRLGMVIVTTVAIIDYTEGPGQNPPQLFRRRFITVTGSSVQQWCSERVQWETWSSSIPATFLAQQASYSQRAVARSLFLKNFPDTSPLFQIGIKPRLPPPSTYPSAGLRYS